MYHRDLECYIKKLRWTYKKQYFDKEVFHEELRIQKLKVAKPEELNLEIPEIRRELEDNRTMVHAKDVETQKFGTQLRNIKGRHERLRFNSDDLAK